MLHSIIQVLLKGIARVTKSRDSMPAFALCALVCATIIMFTSPAGAYTYTYTDAAGNFSGSFHVTGTDVDPNTGLKNTLAAGINQAYTLVDGNYRPWSNTAALTVDSYSITGHGYTFSMATNPLTVPNSVGIYVNHSGQIVNWSWTIYDGAPWPSGTVAELQLYGGPANVNGNPRLDHEWLTTFPGGTVTYYASTGTWTGGADPGSLLYASFPGYGLWKWDGTAWARLTSDMPESMVASGSTLYGDFGTQGLWKYDGSSWSLLTPDNPQTMAVSGSTLYADFGTLGLWKYNGTSWSQLTSDNPENIVASGSTVFGDFGTQGLWKYDGSIWSRLTTDNPENMAVSGTTLYVDFGAIGLWKHNGTSWSQLTSDNPENIAASGSILYGDFGSLGLWKWNGSSWTQLTTSNPENIFASGSNLYGDFGAIGLWKYDGTSWSQLTSVNPIVMVTN